MPKKQRNEVLVGLFSFLGIGLFGLLIFLMGGLSGVFARSAVVQASFPDVQSLQAGDPVYLFGMRVGKVLEIELLPPKEREPARLEVALSLPREYRQYLRKDSVVKIDRSLTGNLSVLIEESDGPPLGEGEALQGSAAVKLGDIAEKVDRVLKEAEGAIATVNRVVKEVEEKGDLRTALAEIASMARDLHQDITPVRDAIQKAIGTATGLLEENRLDLRHSVMNVKETSAIAKNFAERLSKTPEQVESSLAIIRSAGETLEKLVRENRANVDTLLEDLRKTATNAENLSSEVKRRPWRLIYKPDEEEMKALELYDAAWAYNLGATELHRSVRDLAQRLDSTPPGAPRSTALEQAIAQVEASLKRQKEAEERFWQRLSAAE